MAYPISTMIGIRTGGVFAGATVMDNLKEQIIDVITKMEEDDISCGVSAETLDGCISSELTAMKGSYVVIAGVFNYWDYTKTSEFGKRLSDKLGTEIMVMTWDEDLDTFQCGVFLAGKDMQKVNEYLVDRICRRVDNEDSVEVMRQQLKNYMIDLINTLPETAIHKLKKYRPYHFKLIDDKEFETKLRALCIAYDNENGAYPENELEGLSVYEFFTQNGIKDAPTFDNEFAEHVWKASDEWRAQGLEL